jgi:predicted Zn finger-like uncharacterized protein
LRPKAGPLRIAMLIDCPNCATSYQVDTSSIGAHGRSVRCLRCRNVWFAEPEPAPATPSPPEFANQAAVTAFRAELGPEPQPAAEPSAPLEPEPAVDAATDPIAAVESAAPAADEPPAEEPPAEEPPAVEQPAPVALSDIPIPATDAPASVAGTDQRPPLRREPPAIEQGAETIRRAARRPAKARAPAKPKLRLSLAIAMLACICAALVSWRKDVVRAMPQLASFYASVGLPVNLRGLAFTGLSIGRDAHDGVPVLVVEGTIVNTVAMPVEVPRLRFALRNAAGTEVYTWTAVPTQTVLEPGERLPFRSRLASPPEDGHDVQVRFFTRRDVVAGLH